MSSELSFRSVLAALLLFFAAIRIYYRLAATSSGGRASIHESGLNVALRFVFGAGLIASLLAYIINPSWMAWSSLVLPAWMRWFGACLGIVALLMLVWTHQTLGRNFSATLQVRERHTLVTTGPYHWVRHPMYSSFYLLVLALFLVSANWFLGLAWFSVITGVMVTRLKKEEVLMLETFGDQYYQYMKRTGRLVPRLF